MKMNTCPPSSRMSCYHKMKMSAKLNSVLIGMIDLCSDSSSLSHHGPIDRLAPVLGLHLAQLCSIEENIASPCSDLQYSTRHLGSNTDAPVFEEFSGQKPLYVFSIKDSHLSPVRDGTGQNQIPYSLHNQLSSPVTKDFLSASLSCQVLFSLMMRSLPRGP